MRGCEGRRAARAVQSMYTRWLARRPDESIADDPEYGTDGALGDRPSLSVGAEARPSRKGTLAR
jgi:hypothetical protein